MMISRFEESRQISPFMRQWLEGRQDWMDFSDWKDRELLVLWWDIAVFLHSQYGRKLELLEAVMKHRGVDIPRKEDELLHMVRVFI